MIGRILNITKKVTGKKQVSLSDACWEVANELYDFWVYIGNVYPKYLLVIKDQINNDYKEFVRLKKLSNLKKICWRKVGKLCENLQQTNAYIFI